MVDGWLADPEFVTIEVTGGSVVITATITVPGDVEVTTVQNSVAASMSSTETASATLDITVESTPQYYIQSPSPSMPPPFPPPKKPPSSPPPFPPSPPPFSVVWNGGSLALMDETVDMVAPSGSGYSTIRYHRQNLYSVGIGLPILGTNTVNDETENDVFFNGDTKMYAITSAPDPPEPNLWGDGANDKCGHSVSLSRPRCAPPRTRRSTSA